MSRTRAHLPLRARLLLPGAAVECHDHRDGPCDLPDLRDAAADCSSGWPWCRSDTRCQWDVDPHRLPPVCGCRLCTSHHWRRADRRAARQGERRRLRLGRWSEEY